MDHNLLAILLLIAVALVFDYINGFHDAANSIATVVSTRVLTPTQPVKGTWGRNAAHMALITKQLPVRVAIHASELLP